MPLLHAGATELKLQGTGLYDSSVTVFYMAQEDTQKKSRLTTIMQEPGPRATYDAGVGVIV